MNDRQDHIRRLAELIKDVDIAMLTTTTPQGRLVSRPLGTQEVEFDGDLWFATGADSGKVAEINANPHVNVAYASPHKNIYVSVAGTASVVDDRAKVDELWSPAMKRFFPEGKDDPRLRLIKVDAETAEYWEGPGTAFGKALFFVTSSVTGDVGTMTDNERLDLR
ncbi:MAG: pyridoxamine 5'-phosphate oxidase family protein [Pseudomonadota bacterium]|nr:pyridoxamine 5'-phosphate oxidase family protein [Pseudomonadota bacterium]